MARRFLEQEDDDPILSVVNLIDLFLVIVVILLIIVVRNPLNPFSNKNVVVVENPGEMNMKITIKNGEELTRYESDGAIGEGDGIKAGVTYKLSNGKMIYVPE
ncbi:DUF2149 domain-containing protein [Microbulbifer thermotolerans]|uniref:DUF2149 domain-containing protein n=1 Tax=Microbulbifer thermotolerans TaxID=252514 RepID=A0AB35HUJ2_MICTH|nr:DUF2149 domain-containing protein [Microbulbifer thermotolerans]MCX2782373.1 DUF2149 domain-containing protein [Microbulbifer thermotolerans]MCX2800526.1 DUF2149 domain-containing protein [Microbulbifer thermotolerans]MCX2831150.1 DUF2149 domain-containing protein [Microbulbifer thermotolerans]WKT62205.1 DUF2149 domain-containing protein [Microbulbifer thermotolerans]SFB85224.1 hypothetical protein SAMN05660479_00641 [Microbulbifer thermotolerans]